MIQMNEYLDSHKKDIVDFIEGRYIPPNITENRTFDNLATELQNKIVHYHNSQGGGRDAAHNVLAMGIICALWCGWISQAKVINTKYRQDDADSFKKAIIDAFEIGQNYANERH